MIVNIFAWENLQGRDLQEGLDEDGTKILEWILKKKMSIRGTGLIRFKIRLLESSSECGSSETSGSIIELIYEYILNIALNCC